MVLITEEYYDKQKDELQVLQSIFSDDIVSVKIQNCWKVIIEFFKRLNKCLIYSSRAHLNWLLNCNHIPRAKRHLFH